MLTTQHELETVTYRFYVVYNVEISLYNDTVNKSHSQLLTITEMWSLFVLRSSSVDFVSLSHLPYQDRGALMSRRLHNINWLWAQNLFQCVYTFHKIMELHLKHLTFLLVWVWFARFMRSLSSATDNSCEFLFYIPIQI